MPTNKYTIKAETKGFKKAEGQTKKLGGSMKSLTKSVGGVALAYFTTQGLIAGVSAVVKAYGRQEQAEKKLKTALGGTSQALLDQASALQKVTVFGDEATIEQMAFLGSLKFTQSQIKEMIPVAMDLASATGMSLESAVRNTAKTYSGLAGELGEMVPQLRELTAEQMKNGEAVKVMAELFGGQASENAKTMQGRLEQMTNAVGDTAENIGEVLAPVIIMATEVINDFLIALDFIITKTFNVQDTFTGTASTMDGFKTKMDLLKTSGVDFGDALGKLAQQEAGLRAEMEALNPIVQESIDLGGGYSMSLNMAVDSTSSLTEGISIISEEQANFTRALVESGMGLDELKQKQQDATAVTLTDNSARIEAINFLLEEIGLKREYIDTLSQESTPLQELQIAYDELIAKREVDNTAKIEQMALDLALKDGVDQITQSYLDQAEAIMKGGEIAKATTEQKLASMSQLTGGLAKLAGEFKGGAKVQARLAQTQAVIDTWAGANKALASAPPPWNFIAMAGVIATGMANVANISSSIGDFHTGGLIGGGDDVPINAQGGEFVMRRDAVNRIGVDALSNMNEGGGGGITLNISAPLIDDTIIDTIVPAIDRARREGLA